MYISVCVCVDNSIVGMGNLNLSHLGCKYIIKSVS